MRDAMIAGYTEYFQQPLRPRKMANLAQIINVLQAVILPMKKK
jgi:alpha-L-arabinofuranosidase